jgi:predicted esterase
MRSSHRLGGCIVLSSWLPFRNDYPRVMTDAAKHLRVFQAHGDEDMVVSHEWGHGSHNLLKTLLTGEEPKFLTIAGMGHSSHPKEIDAVDKFLHHVLK